MHRLLLLVIPALLLGCAAEQTTNGLDPDRILHMAGEEAGQIVSPRERLTRQLNIANRETNSGKPINARNTLALARKTLEQAAPKDFTDQERLAGWISICELSRNAGDKGFANGALDQAMVALNQLTPDPARCEYVPGIEAEVRILRGDAAAAGLLRTAADWAMDLQPQTTRRSAFLVFTEELFRCNDYEGGRLVLRHDKDAAWRSDSLTALSDQARSEMKYNASGGFGTVVLSQAMAAAPDREATTGMTLGATTEPVNTRFGKSLDFKSNYYKP